MSHEAYEALLTENRDKLKLSQYWHPNPLMTNVHFPHNLVKSIPTYITLYDLIPYMLPEKYLNAWPKPIAEDYQTRLTTITTHAKGIFSISSITTNDFSSSFPHYQGDIITTDLGVDGALFQPYPHATYKNERYILYVGGFDPRKNMIGSLKAFAKLKKKHPSSKNIFLYIVCGHTEKDAQTFLNQAKKLGVSDHVRLLGQISDDYLAHLYANAEIFFFPSLYEGFGLPILEAMSSGTPVLTSINPCFSEEERACLYCDPNNIGDMADKLNSLLANSKLRNQLAKDGINIARRYTWARTITYYEDTLLRQTQTTSSQPIKIAMITPWTPQQTGIATYAEHLSEALSSLTSLSIFTPCKKPEQSRHPDCTFYPLNALKKMYEQFDAVIYHIGNNAAFHKDIYKLAWHYPGIIVLHDYNIQPFLLHSFYLDKKESSDYYFDALAYYEDLDITAIKASNAHPMLDTWKYPSCEALVKRAKAVIVHNHWVKKQLAQHEHVHVVPLSIINHWSVDETKLSQLRSTYKLDPSHYILGIFGHCNKNKRVHIVLEAATRLLEKGYPIKLLAVGKLDAAIETLLQSNEVLKPHVIQTDYVDDDVFVHLMTLCDIIINLRKPSMGETSGPLAMALALGKATLVSNYHQFAELPDDITIKIDTDEFEIEELVEVTALLLKQPNLRAQLGENAKAFANQYASCELVAQKYLNLSHDTIDTAKQQAADALALR